MRRLALGLSLIGCLLAPVTSEALGLGSIDVRTSLNQPLQADIELLGVNPSDLSGVTAVLAPSELFSRVGIPRPDYLGRLQFKVVRSSDGKPVIRVSTNQPLRQPFLDFLLEVNWSGGRLLREYTILLNPPDYMHGRSEASAQMPSAIGAPPAQAASPVTTSPMLGMQPSISKPKPSATPPSKHAAATSMAGTARQYRVVKGDALWRIAKREGASTSTDINQMMVGILRANPQAFIKGNVNGLRTGYVLRIPPTAQITRISQAQATAEVSRQNALWHQYAMRMAGKTVSESQLKAAGSSSPQTNAMSAHGKETTTANGHLRILGTEAKSPGMGGAKLAMADEGQAKLRHELSLAKEAVASNQQQIGDLQSRIDALQGIVSKQQKLLELKNQELAGLQAKLGHATTTDTRLAMPVMPVAATGKPAAPLVSMPSAATAMHPVAVAPAQSAQKPEVKQAMPPAVKAAQPAKTSLVDMLFGNQNYLMAAGGLVLLLLALLWLIVRRSAKTGQAPTVRGLDHAAGPSTKDIEPHFEAETSSSGAAAAVVAGVGAAAAMAAVAGSANEDADIGSSAPESDDDELGELPMLDDENVPAIEEAAPSDDVLAEADVYIAYGLYPQAESVIQKALEDDPDNLNYRSKLLECYYSANDQPSFDREAQVLFDSMPGAENDPIWQCVATLGKSLSPENPLFTGTDTNGLSADDIIGAKSDLGGLDLGESGSLDELDLDGVEADATEETGAAATDDAFDLDDFDLGDDLGSEAEASAPIKIDDGETDGDDLDSLESLDFSIDELDLPDDMAVATESADEHGDLDLDFETLDISSPEPEQTVAGGLTTPAADEEIDALDFDMDLAGDTALTEAGEAPADSRAVQPQPEPEPGLDSTSVDAELLSSASELDDLDAFGELDDLEFDVGEVDAEPATEGSGLITDGDEVATKLDLAKAYIDMGDEDGAQSTLQEVLAEGSPEQREEAESLLKQIG